MEYLPGTLLKDTVVFNLKIGQKVYDKDSNTLGIISDIRETSSEYIEAIIKLEGKEELKSYQLPNCVLL